MRIAFGRSGLGPGRLSGRSVACLCALLMIVGFAADGAAASDPAKTVGPNACAECHKHEAAAWKGTHHFKTFREMPRKAEANKIGKKMGVRRIKSGALCLNCHFTVQQKEGREKIIAGISCESCHSAGQDWIKVHSSFSGKTPLFESKAEAKARWKLAESKGMIRPNAFYQLAKNCYGCHVVPQEDLVNKGGHQGGQRFRAGFLVTRRGAAQHLVFHGQRERAGQRGAQADALSRRPRRRARDGIARDRQRRP